MASNGHARRARLVAEPVAGAASPPRLADACRNALLTRIAQGRGRIGRFDDSRAIADFDSPLRALNAALRLQYDLADANRDLPAPRRFLYRVGVGFEDAAALCARAEPGRACVDDGVLAAAAGRLDFDSVDLGPLRPGAPARAHAVSGALTGRVFRYRPWSTPGRRRASLVLAGALIAAAVAGLAAGRRRGAP